MYYVYVLRSLKDGNSYIGITDDLERRLKQHNSGSNASTKYRRPFEIIYKELTPDRITARRREKFLKSGDGRTWLKINIRPL